MYKAALSCSQQHQLVTRCPTLVSSFFSTRIPPLTTDSPLLTNSRRFVPTCQDAKMEDILRLTEFLSTAKNLVLLSGAGLSTESGIPDYRSEGVGLYATSKNRPITISEFLSSSARRQRYWARNFTSWPAFGSLRPNLSHAMLAHWEREVWRGPERHLLVHITQNVDTLLQKAGCRNVVELHGSSARVKCLHCAHDMSRDEMQELLVRVNPNWSVPFRVDMAPDNDVQLPDEMVQRFVLPDCPKCAKDLLIPNIVFFGDNVPKSVVEAVRSNVDKCDTVLVLGSSLHVFSSYRILLHAKDLCKNGRKIRIAILNIGKTRADSLADLKIDARCSDVLPKIVF